MHHSATSPGGSAPLSASSPSARCLLELGQDNTGQMIANGIVPLALLLLGTFALAHSYSPKHAVASLTIKPAWATSGQRPVKTSIIQAEQGRRVRCRSLVSDSFSGTGKASRHKSQRSRTRSKRNSSNYFGPQLAERDHPTYCCKLRDERYCRLPR